jgi:hypothetical protein
VFYTLRLQMLAPDPPSPRLCELRMRLFL